MNPQVAALDLFETAEGSQIGELGVPDGKGSEEFEGRAAKLPKFLEITCRVDTHVTVECLQAGCRDGRLD